MRVRSREANSCFIRTLGNLGANGWLVGSYSVGKRPIDKNNAPSVRCRRDLYYLSFSLPNEIWVRGRLLVPLSQTQRKSPGATSTSVGYEFLIPA
jgi:hypothetical protein